MLVTLTTYNKIGVGLNYNREFESLEALIEWLSSPTGKVLFSHCNEVFIEKSAQQAIAADAKEAHG